MGIDVATWRARIGLNGYHMCCPFQTRWRNSGGRLYQPGVASWGVGEVMNGIPLVLKGCMTVVALSLILQYVVHSWSKLKGKGRCGKVHCNWREFTCRMGRAMNGWCLLLRAIVVVIPLLLVIAGDVETNPGPGEPSLKALLNELHPVRASWYKIGVQLDIPHTTLDCFKQNHSDQSDLMCEVLKHWLKTAVDPPPTWEVVVIALRSPLVNEISVAAQLEAKFCTSVQHLIENPSKGSLTTIAARPRGSASPPPSEGSQRPPFGCGCGKCTFFSFIERGCPTPIPSPSSFPYLDLSGLTHEQQEELMGRLQFESQKIIMRFQELLSTTIKSLIRRNVSQDELLIHVMALGAFKPVFKKPQVPAFHHCFKELTAADTIPKVFLVLKDYFSFFNYHIIEHIIKELGTEEDKAELQRYKEEFNRYAKRRIFKCMPQFGPVSDADHADIFVKLDSQYDDYTVAEVKRFCHKLSEILRISSQGILRVCQVDKVCLQLMFQVPLFVQQDIFPLSREQERALIAMDIIRLTCGEYQFLGNKQPQARVDKNHQDDTDDDSGMGPSTFTDTTSATFSEDFMDKEMKEVDYELKVQGLVETASSHKSESGLELHHAAAMGQLEYVRFLVEKENISPMLSDHNGLSAFHLAAIAGNLQILKYFITKSNCNPACPGPLGLTPLCLASQQGHLDVVRYLVIEQQMDPLYEDEYGSTPLHRACAGGFQAVVEFLTSELKKYTPIAELVSDPKNKWDSTPLHSAVVNGHLNILKFFICDQNCDKNSPGWLARTPLHYAAGLGHLHIVKYLIHEQGCNPMYRDFIQDTPLHMAAMTGCTDIVKFLTEEKCCDPMCRNYQQDTPLHLAAHIGYIDIVKFLTLEMNCNPTSRNTYNATPLHLAVVEGHMDIIQFFISDQNCNPDIPGQYSGTPLHYAARFGQLHIVKYLIDEQHCSLSCLDEHQYTPLHCAAMEGHIDIVEFLTVEKHFDPTSRDANQNTPLHKAAQHGHLDIVKYFICHQKTDPNIPGQYSGTPLHPAAGLGHLNVVKYLIDEQGCNPSCLDKYKYTPLHHAAINGHLNIVKFLTVKKHCDPLCRNSDQDTPLHMAAIGGHTEVVRFLTLEMHCDPTSRNANNYTALHLAAAKGNLDIVKFFLSEQNCDPNIPGQDNKIPLHCAAEFGHLHIVKYLVDEQGCKPSCLDKNWRSPLHHAAAFGRINIVKFLTVTKHCDPLSRDIDDNTALHCASLVSGHLETVKFFIEELKCPPDLPGYLNSTPHELATSMNHSDTAQYLQKHSVIHTAIAMMKQLGFLK